MTAPRCVGCGASDTELRVERGELLCFDCLSEREDSYHQDQEQDQEQDQAFPDAPPGPGGNSLDDGPELYRLEAAYAKGILKPIAVPVGESPPHAGSVMKAISDHLRLLTGLRWAVGDRRPLPYANSLAVANGLAADKGVASKALNALVRAGVWECVGTLPPQKPGLDGTKLYAPPAANVVTLGDRRAA